MVEIHSECRVSVQAEREPHPQRRPAALGPSQGRGLQVPQNENWQEVPAAG